MPSTRTLIHAMVAAAAVLFAAAAPGLTQGTPGVTDSEIVIGSCAALEGPASFLGTQTVLGARAYLAAVNEQGGVHGRKIKLIARDDGYEPDKTIACVNQLIQQDRVFAMGFFVGTPTGAKAVPMAEAHRVPVVGFFTGAEILRAPVKKHVIHVRASYYDEARAMVDNLVKNLGVRRVAVFYQEDAFGLAVLEGVKIALRRHELAPVALGTYPRNTMDIGRGLEQIKPAQPEAVVMVGTYAPLAEFVKRARADRWPSLFLTVSFVGTEAFARAAGKDGEGVIITQVVPPPSRTDLPGVKAYVRDLKKVAPDAQPNFVSLEGYVNALVLVEGLRQAGRELSRERFLAAVEGVRDLDLGIGMKATYGPGRHHAFDQVFSTLLRNGEAVVFTDWKQVARK
jgi:ABC-type branched-subunit amino acid transport system substrate-binding protein